MEFKAPALGQASIGRLVSDDGEARPPGKSTFIFGERLDYRVQDGPPRADSGSTGSFPANRPGLGVSRWVGYLSGTARQCPGPEARRSTKISDNVQEAK